jgi:membrane associated rhomboid family serine protease
MTSILAQILLQPITTLLILLMCSMWFYLNQYLIPVDQVAFCYDSVMEKREYWRGLTSALSHYSFIHLVFNMSSLWSFGFLENSTMEYCKTTFLLLLISFVVQVMVYKVLIDRFQMEQYKHVLAVGYSCVVFGWMTYSSMAYKGAGMFGLPSWAMPWFSLFVTQLIVPQASFIGHASGIVGGYLIYFGAFVWFTNWIFVCCLVWVVIMILYSIRVSSNWLDFVQYASISPQGGAVEV